MPFVKSLLCRECGREYPVEPSHVCEFCFGPLEVAYDYDAISRVLSRERIQSGPHSMWRYEDLLPVSRETGIDMGTGFTPLMRADGLRQMLGLTKESAQDGTIKATKAKYFMGMAKKKAKEQGIDLGFKNGKSEENDNGLAQFDVLKLQIGNREAVRESTRHIED